MDRSRLKVKKIELKPSSKTNKRKNSENNQRHVNNNYLTTNIIYNNLCSN